MVSVLFSILLTAAAPQFEVRTLDGRTVVGTIAELNSDRATIETDDGRVSLATDELVGLFSREKPDTSTAAGDVRIGLVDGSWLVATEYTVRDGRAEITFTDGRLVELPVGGVGSVRLQAQSGAVADEWSRIVQMKINTDLLVVRKAETIDYHQGVLREVTGEVVRFELGGDVLPVRRSKVHGLVYYHPQGDDPAETICRITDATGSQWSARSVTLEENLHWTTPAGATVTRPLVTITQIDFSHGKIVFLSDLSPESVTFTPYFGTGGEMPALAKFLAPRDDVNLESGPLKLDGKQYGKGLALHSRTRVVYRLPGRFRRFRAVAGIDDTVRPHGDVRLVIYGDEQVLLEATVRGTDPPQPLDLDLQGVRRITLLTDFGGQMDVADHLDLCEARIIK